MRTRHADLLAVFTLSVLAGCGTPDVSDSQTEDLAETSSIVTIPTTPTLPEVPFDPCAHIDDAFLLKFGLQPARIDPDVITIGRETMVGCGIIGDERAINLVAQNTPWDQIPFHVTPNAITINGRETWYVPGSLSDDSCSVLMRTTFGAVIVNNNPRLGRRPDPDMDRCDSIVEIAEAIEPFIDGA